MQYNSISRGYGKRAILESQAREKAMADKLYQIINLDSGNYLEGYKWRESDCDAIGLDAQVSAQRMADKLNKASGYPQWDVEVYRLD